KGRFLLGMIDTGAQANIISEDVLPLLKYQEVEIPAVRVSGLGGKTVPLTKSVCVEIEINEQKLWPRFIVVTEVKGLIIMGLPFLEQLRAVISIPTHIMTTMCGPIALYSVSDNKARKNRLRRLAESE